MLGQGVFLLEMAFGILFLARALRSEHLVTEARGQAGPGWPRVLAWLLWGQLAVLACAVFAGAFGYMRLARLLGTEVLASSFVALVLYAGVRVGEGLVAYVLRARPLRLMFSVQQHRELLQRRVDRALRWISVGAWVYFTLDGLGVMSTSLTAADTVLSARYVRGSVSLSLGDVVAFGLTIWAAFLLSSFVRFVLHEDVYPRVGLPRGLPYALSSLLHYIIVLVGFVFAVAALASISRASRSWRARSGWASASGCRASSRTSSPVSSCCWSAGSTSATRSRRETCKARSERSGSARAPSGRGTAPRSSSRTGG